MKNIIFELFQLALAIILAVFSTALVVSQWYLAGEFTFYIGAFSLIAITTYVMVIISWKEYKEANQKH